MGQPNLTLPTRSNPKGPFEMSEILSTWKNEIVAELAEARTALAEAVTAAKAAKERHQEALATVETVKSALARLPSLATTLEPPIAGRVTEAAAETDRAAMAARRAILDEKAAEIRVARLESAVGQLSAVLAAAAEPAEVAA